MRPLFVSFFTVLTGVVHADQYALPPVHRYALPMHEAITIYEMPVYPEPEIVYVQENYPGRRIVTPAPYTASKPVEQKPMEQAIAVPRPLEPLAPFAPPATALLAPRFPSQTDEQGHETVRGQSRSVDELAGLLGSPPPLAKGAVEEGTIDPKLMGTIDAPDLDEEISAAGIVQNTTKTTLANTGTKSADPLGHTVLLIVTAITTIGLLYMAFVAYDYRQRWMQSLMMQNDRYLGGAFDMERAEDIYGAYSGSPSFSEGLGLTRRSI